MEPQSNSRNLILFMVLAMAVLLGWNYFFPPPQVSPQEITRTTPAAQTAAVESTLQKSRPLRVKTDVFNIVIDEDSGDIRGLSMPYYNAASDAEQAFVLFQNTAKDTYVAQSPILDNQSGQYLPAVFQAAADRYTLSGDTLEVRLRAEGEGFRADKIYTFRKGSYLIGLKHEITNTGSAPLDISAVYRLLRDNHDPEGENRFAYTYTGPVLYTPQDKFQKIDFSEIDKNRKDYPQTTQSGWLGMIQHYFAATWILQPKDGESVCRETQPCLPDFSKRSDGLYQAGVRVPVQPIAAGATAVTDMQLYAGPQIYSALVGAADHLQLVKDYGRVHIFAAPLFWLLNKLHDWVGNWGWAIVLLVIIVKALLFPLTAASFRSMAKMRAVAPRLQALKEQYGDDRMKMQQEMMEMYKKEKINPLGGCLPMLIQIPVFIGLYWALLSSVELRQAPWGWITDLARTDPYFILPLVMAGTMYLQTLLNPPPPDPMQAKMMKIMPIMFSILFFFFPAGLVLYYVVNNILSMAQQWYINRQIENNAKLHRPLDAKNSKAKKDTAKKSGK